MLIATWFGVGLIPVAPGTCAALTALPAAWLIRNLWGLGGLAVATVMVFVAGCWAAGAVAKASAAADPGQVVIDEVAGQWLVLLLAPSTDPIAWGLSFLLFRLFDIWKPWPVRWIDRHIHGGIGIMLDDVAAAAYAGLGYFALSAIGGAFGVRP